MHQILNLWRKLREYTKLSEYESKVYVALVKNGPSTASELSLISGVPRTKIYQTLDKLIGRGLAAEMPGEPRVFTPIPPSSAFKPHAETLEEMARDLHFTIYLLENAYERSLAEAKTIRDDLWLVRGKPNIVKVLCSAMLRAEGSIQILTSEEGLIFLFKVAGKVLDRLVERGVEVHISAPLGFKNRYVVQELRYICKIHEIDQRDLPLSTIITLIDGEEALIALLKMGRTDLSINEDIAVLTKNRVLCIVLSELTRMKGKKISLEA